MIEVVGLTKRFGEIAALSDVSFKVDKGQIVGFLGANGAGKTTTMDILCGCLGADQGTASIAGFDITENPIEAKRHLGYLPDVPPLYDEMRVRDLIAYAARLKKVPTHEINAKVDRALARLSIENVTNRLVGNLSKGYRQRVAFAQAIVHEPSVLILDEPTEGLDPNQIIQIRKLIRELGGDHTIILSSHILPEVQQTCDTIIIIDKGRIVQQGTYNELISKMQSGQVYHLKVRREPDVCIDAIRGVAGVASAKVVAPNVIEIHLHKNQDDEIMDQVASVAVAKQCGIKELTPQNKTLEDVFFQLTH